MTKDQMGPFKHEALPCPCCGSTRIRVGLMSPDAYGVQCLDCGIRTEPVTTSDPRISEFSEGVGEMIRDDADPDFDRSMLLLCGAIAVETWNYRGNRGVGEITSLLESLQPHPAFGSGLIEFFVEWLQKKGMTDEEDEAFDVVYDWIGRQYPVIND